MDLDGNVVWSREIELCTQFFSPGILKLSVSADATSVYVAGTTKNFTLPVT